MAEWRISRRQGVCAACEREFEDGQRHVSALQVSPEGLARADFCFPCWDAREEHAPLPTPPEPEYGARHQPPAEAAEAPDSAEPDQPDADAGRQDEPSAEDPEYGASHPPPAEPDAGRQVQPAAEEPAAAGVTDLFWWATRHEVAKRKTVQLDLQSLERLFLELEGNESEAVQELRYVLCLILMRKRRLKVERVLRLADGEAFRVKRPRRDERYEVRVFDFSPERMAEIRTQLQAIFDGADGPGGLTLSEDGVEEEAVAVEDAPLEDAAPPVDPLEADEPAADQAQPATHEA